MSHHVKVIGLLVLVIMAVIACKDKQLPPVPAPVTFIPEPPPPPRDSFWWVGIDTFTFSKELFVGDIALPFQLLLPPNLPKDGRKYPLAMILHGSNMRGEDNEKQLESALVKIWHGGDTRQQVRPTIIVAPQCPSGRDWTEPDIYNTMVDMLDALIGQYPIDTDSMYLSGFSIGGSGAFKMMSLEPNRWAAACMVSSYSSAGVANPNSFYFVPQRIIIAQDDPIIIYDQAVDYVQLIWEAKGNPGVADDTTDVDLQFKVFPDSLGLGHNISDTVSQLPDYLEFFYTRGK